MADRPSKAVLARRVIDLYNAFYDGLYVEDRCFTDQQQPRRLYIQLAVDGHDLMKLLKEEQDYRAAELHNICGALLLTGRAVCQLTNNLTIQAVKDSAVVDHMVSAHRMAIDALARELGVDQGEGG